MRNKTKRKDSDLHTLDHGDGINAPLHDMRATRPIHTSTAEVSPRMQVRWRNNWEHETSETVNRHNHADMQNKTGISIKSSLRDKSKAGSTERKDRRSEKRKMKNKAEQLNATATELLSKGRNEEALDTYRHAMHCAREDMMR
eukprot:847450-Ditylum_brightwellii.AAC.1